MASILLFLTILISAYLIGCIIKFGIPKSISETYYLLDKYGWLFQVTLFAVAFLVVPTLIDRSSDNTRFLAFLACMGLVFVGASPLFKRKLDGKVHYISAAMCCGGLVLWQVFNACWVVPLICFIAILPPMLFDGKKMWWLEIATIVSAYVSLIWF